MQEFRPASVIESDTALAHSFRDGDVDAVRSLVGRYGAPVIALAARSRDTGSDGDRIAQEVAREVFVRAWREADGFDAGHDFAPWLASITQDVATSADDPVADLDEGEIERAWAIASATSALPDDQHRALRAYYVDGIDPDTAAGIAADIAPARVRLERRLDHLHEPGGVDTVLAEPGSWVRPDAAFADRVLAEIRLESGAADGEVAGADVDAGRRRSFRPAFIGFGAALTVLLGTILLLSAVTGAPESEDVRTELTPTGRLLDVDGGEIVITARDSGLEIDLDAPGLPRRSGGSFYQGLITLDDGSVVTVGSFNEGTDVTLFGGVDLDRVVGFTVVLSGVDDTVDTADGVVLKADVSTR